MNNEGPELSPEARRIITDARGFDDPTPEDQARVKARWLASVAALAGVSSLTEAARAAGTGWGLKAVGAALAVFAGAVGLYVALPSEPETHPVATGQSERRHHTSSGAQREPAPTSSGAIAEVQPSAAEPLPEPAHPVPIAPAPGAASVSAAPAIQEERPAVADEAAGARPITLDTPSVAEVRGEAAAPARRERAASGRRAAVRATRRPGPNLAVAPEKPSSERAVVERPAQESAPAAAGPTGQLKEELGVLSEIRSSIQAGAPSRALQLLADYEARFERPIMAMEADALRVDALCHAGQRDAARTSARAFQNEWPGSPLGPRVSAACP